MSAASGIGLSSGLSSKFAEAIESKSTRFIKLSIRDESIVYDLELPCSGSFAADLEKLQDPDILDVNEPAYILAKLDEPSPDWMAICYVPDSAKVRDKMIYASSRASLIKSLGSSLFTDSLFATSKKDLTADAYASHLVHLAAPKPLSAREQELADLRLQESETISYEGSRARASHVGNSVGYQWTLELQEAVAAFATGAGGAIITITIDPSSETLALTASLDITIDRVVSSIPHSEPCYALIAWVHTYTGNPLREIIFAYSCPSTSPIKNRMLYSSGTVSTFLAAKSLLLSAYPDLHLASRRIETSDPNELDEEFLKIQLGYNTSTDTTIAGNNTSTQSFVKPRAPARRR